VPRDGRQVAGHLHAANEFGAERVKVFDSYFKEWRE
jgi:hypothetical protein